MTSAATILGTTPNMSDVKTALVKALPEHLARACTENDQSVSSENQLLYKS